MSEDRYVVRDRDGHYWRYHRDGYAECDSNRVEVSRDDALSLKRHPSPRAYAARAYKVKAKAKAPREVRVIVKNGEPKALVNEERAAEGINLLSSERIVRYVLAEGE